MGKRLRSNRLLGIRNGVAYVDVSTPRCPNAVAQLDASDLRLMLDGGTRWRAVRVKKKSAQLYVSRNVGPRGAVKVQLLHRIVLGLTKREFQGDHRNGNGLDNRRRNLRFATNAQNSANGRSHVDSTSRYRGVSWDVARKKWTATIGTKTGKRRSLGRFTSEVEAAHAYDEAAIERYGEFARPNFKRKFHGK